MAQQQAFCVQCGQPLSSGVSFCRSCGAPTAGQAAVNAPSSQIAYSQARQRRRPNILLVVVGILLILIGLIQPAAHLFGEETTAGITNIDQQIDSASDKMDYNYQINYTFSVDGKQYAGSYQMNKVYNVAKLPQEGSLLAVKYLAFLPGVNAPVNQGNPFLILLVAGGIGILLLVIGIKGRIVVQK